MTLELWSDPENDGELSCCSAQAVRGARELAHGLGMRAPLDRPARRVPRRRGRALAGRPRRRRDAEPVRALQRQRAPRRDARARRPPRRADARRPATTRACRTGGCCALRPTSARTRATCSRRSRRGSLARLRFPLGDAAQGATCASSRARAGLAVAAQARLAGPVLPRGHAPGARFLERHGGLGARPGRDRRRAPARARRARAARTVHRRPAPRPRDRRRRRRCTCSPPTRARNTVTVGPREELLAARVAVRELTLHRDGACVDGVRVRAHGRGARAAAWRTALGAGRHAGVQRRARRAGRAHRARAARLPVRRRAGRRPRHHRRLRSLLRRRSPSTLAR